MNSHATTRDRMVEAAIEVLEREGEKAIRTRDISAAAGVQYSAVEYHFGGRDGLIEAALLEKYRRDYTATLLVFRSEVEKCESAEQFRQTVINVVRMYMKPNRYAARAIRAAVMGSATTRPSLAEQLARVNDDIFDHMAETLKGPMDRGWLQAGHDLRMLSAFYMALVNGRLLVEFGEEKPEHEALNRYLIEATLAVGFREAPGAGA